MMETVAYFGAMGLVEPRPGFKDDPDFFRAVYVDFLGGSRLKTNALRGRSKPNTAGEVTVRTDTFRIIEPCTCSLSTLNDSLCELSQLLLIVETADPQIADQLTARRLPFVSLGLRP